MTLPTPTLRACGITTHYVRSETNNARAVSWCGRSVLRGRYTTDQRLVSCACCLAVLRGRRR